MNTQHTPGPWIFSPTYQDEEGNWFVSVIREGGGKPFIAKVGGRTQEEAEANARLIAAALELLTACERALARIEAEEETAMDTGDHAMAKVYAAEASHLTAAIAKAKGQQ